MNPEKTERNQKIFEKWKTGKYSYRDLAREHKRNVSAIWFIVKRWREREEEKLDGV